jgi:tetratricopeptide (TPR) repeat protein/predicted Ser/Thr protein kinase
MEPRLAEAAPLVMRPGVQVGRFRLSHLLGMGGMGSVWAAVDPELGREVAIKVLRIGVGSPADQAASRTRLRREAKAMARLTHPNVVPVFEIGEVQGRLFLVMELVEGVTLARWLEEKHPFERLLEVFTGAGEGLAAAHAAGVVHRDFKPQNVLVGKDGRARVMDFGLASGFAPGEADSLPPDKPISLSDLASLPTGAKALTPMGALLGTPAYMSPEQMRGQKADARSDLFAFCTMFFEAAYGVLPYPAQNFPDLRARAESGRMEHPRSHGVPGWVRKELTRGLLPDPAKRHASMEELLSRLRRGRARAMRTSIGIAVAAVAGLALVFGLVQWRLRAAAPHPRSVAVLAPHNFSDHVDAAWIGPVVAELLASDLAADSGMRVLPEAEVAAAISDLGLRGALPQPKDVARLKKRLNVDLVVGGTYSLSQTGTLRTELALWSSANKTGFVSQMGDQTHLTALAAGLSGEVRGWLGLPPRSASATVAFPDNLESARLYAEGLQFLHDREAAHASAVLAQAAALSPESARIQLALAESLLFLRQEAPAREAARRAFELSDSLSPDDRTRAEIFYRRALGDRERAVLLARARYDAAPNDLDRGLDVAEELMAARRWPEIPALTAELRKLPPPAGTDARIDLISATACLRTADLKCALESSRRAYASAQERGARWQTATARFREGEALRRSGDAARSLPLLAEAERLYTECGDRGSAASVRQMSATIFADQGDLASARREFETALAFFNELGDRLNEGAVMHNLSVLLRRSRDLPAALVYANRATTTLLEAHEQRPASNAMTTLGNLRLDLGDLPGAVTALTQAAAIRRKEQDPFLVSTLQALAMVRLLQADFETVRALLIEARAADQGQEPLVTGRIHQATAALALAEGKPAEAASEATLAAALFKSGVRIDEEVQSEALLSRALLAQGQPAAAREAAARAQKLAESSASRIGKPVAAIAVARVEAVEHPQQIDEPVKLLHQVAAEAQKTGVATDSWEARLTLAQIEQRASRPGAHDKLMALAADARAQGFVLYAQQAEAAASGVIATQR